MISKKSIDEEERKKILATLINSYEIQEEKLNNVNRKIDKLKSELSNEENTEKKKGKNKRKIFGSARTKKSFPYEYYLTPLN